MKSSVNLSGLSGNEIYCLAQKNWTRGGIVVGNSVQSLGLIGNISSGLKSIAGGEIENPTSLISEGRHAAIARIETPPPIVLPISGFHEIEREKTRPTVVGVGRPAPN